MVKIMLAIRENQFYPFHPCSQLASHSEATKMSSLFNLRPLSCVVVINGLILGLKANDMSSMDISSKITKLSQLDPNGQYTYGDYLTWQFKERVELIRGRLFKMSPAPSSVHQRIISRLHIKLGIFLLGKSCEIIGAPIDVRLPVSLKKGKITTVLQPDLCVVCNPGIIDEKGIDGAPDLVIEVLSPGNSKREMNDKFQVYEEAGVSEYWIIDPALQIVLIYVLNEEHRFIGLAPLVSDDILYSKTLDGFSINLGEVFIH